MASKLPGEMNFKGYHDVVASSLAAPSVGGAVHPGFDDVFWGSWTCSWQLSFFY